MDDLLEEAVGVCIQYDRASASLLQRRLSIGYARAARLIDQLESTGVLTESDGSSKPREVLIKSLKEFQEKNKKLLSQKSKDDEILTVKEYIPKNCDFLPKEIKSLVKPTDLPYLKTDLEKIGNLIVFGNVICKKYEYIKTYLLFLLSKFDLDDVRLIIDDNSGKLNGFSNIPHLQNSKDTESTFILRWLCHEVDRRIGVINKNENEKFSVIVYIGNITNIYNFETQDAIKRLSSMGAYAKIHLILIGDRLGDFPKMLKDNISARLEFNKFGEYEAVFNFKEKIKINITELDSQKAKDYLNNIS